MQVRFSQLVESDLDEIAAYIAADNPRRAVTFIQQIRTTIARISSRPLTYQLRPDIEDEARVSIVGQYVILFRVDDSAMYVERVVHGSRVLPRLYEEPARHP